MQRIQAVGSGGGCYPFRRLQPDEQLALLTTTNRANPRRQKFCAQRRAFCRGRIPFELTAFDDGPMNSRCLVDGLRASSSEPRGGPARSLFSPATKPTVNGCGRSSTGLHQIWRKRASKVRAWRQRSDRCRWPIYVERRRRLPTRTSGNDDDRMDIACCARFRRCGGLIVDELLEESTAMCIQRLK